jgi:hypothetical protein
MVKNKSVRKQKSKKKKRTIHFKELLSNVAIVGLTAIIIFFGWSALTSNPTQHNSNTNEISLEELYKKTIRTEYEKRTGHKINVEILNGCGVTSLATKYKKFLKKNGFDVRDTDDADHYDYEFTQIIIRSDDIEQSKEIASILGVWPEFITQKPGSDILIDITIIIGKDYMNSPAYNDIKRFSTK